MWLRGLVIHFLIYLGRSLWPSSKEWLLRYKPLAIFFLVFLLYLMLALLTVSTTGCGSIQKFFNPGVPDRSASVVWARDMMIEINGTKFAGTATPERSDLYRIRVYPNDERVDRIQWSSCHGGRYCDKGKECLNVKFKKSHWWSGDIEYVEFWHSPTRIESDRSCHLKVIGLEKKHKTMSFGMVIFPDSRAWVNVPALLECNFDIVRFEKGVSYCEAPVGTIHRITFQGEIHAVDRPAKTCPPVRKVGVSMYEWFMPRDDCIYTFMGRGKHPSGNRFMHKLNTRGTEQNPPPEASK